ncbi:DUF1499 domain-containing protein [Woeseia oceani]|uniref:DUF1499 domain-containing protein n=1 Tax=Woeseia oceani TaxID=1548547 RepID=A0A193LJM5_9GAMM|nr:DUF1499 domain-containing protein [Woeseia oceani]ANO52717.1 hypothetical protein BA177_17330 [Woeseia oceani]
MKLSKTALFIAILAAILLLVAGPGARFGLWSFGTGFLLLRIALYAGLAVAVLSLLFLLIPKTRAGGSKPLAIALLIGLAVAWVPYSQYRTARSVPAIHDITTDTVNPPPFVAIIPLRADARNPPEYMGEEIATQQRESYPDIQTLELDASPAETFQRARKAVEDMGLEVVAAVANEGRIEATATTFWFGFKDDVVIRIEARGNGSRLDIRSKSRVGRSDVGANAARIRRFVSLFQDGN